MWHLCTGWGSWVELHGCRKLRLNWNYCFHYQRKDSYSLCVSHIQWSDGPNVATSKTARALPSARPSALSGCQPQLQLSPSPGLLSSHSSAQAGSACYELPPLQASFTPKWRMRTGSFIDLCVDPSLGPTVLSPCFNCAVNTSFSFTRNCQVEVEAVQRDEEIMRGILNHPTAKKQLRGAFSLTR